MVVLLAIVVGLVYLLIGPAHSLNNGNLEDLLSVLSTCIHFHDFSTSFKVLDSLHPWDGTPGALSRSKQDRVRSDMTLCNNVITLLQFARCGRDYCDAKMVMSAADAMATNGMKEAGYEYIIISGKARQLLSGIIHTFQNSCVVL